MIGTLINSGAILLGAFLGLLVGKSMKKSMSECVMQGLGLAVIVIGLQGALATTDILLMIVCIAFGGMLGAWVDIDQKVRNLGDYAQKKLSANGGAHSTFSQGFVTACLVFCIGAMGVVGALDSGIRGDHATLIAKAMLDGIGAMVFASSLGIGVAFSAFIVLIYQGSIALLGTVIAPFLTELAIGESAAIGGVLIIGIGLNLTLDKDIKVANLVPAIFIPYFYYPILQLLSK